MERLQPLLNTAQVSEYTLLSQSTLRKMRMLSDGGGLPFIRLGRKIVYRLDDVLAFIEARRVSKRA